MFHPLGGDLSNLNEHDLEEKIKDLSKKYLTAQRLGKNEVLTQLQTFITIYREELKMRYLQRKSQDDDDLNKLINVD